MKAQQTCIFLTYPKVLKADFATLVRQRASTSDTNPLRSVNHREVGDFTSHSPTIFMQVFTGRLGRLIKCCKDLDESAVSLDLEVGEVLSRLGRDQRPGED